MADAKPTAKFVAFQSYYDVKQMPLGQQAGIELPYVEGLRLDEAMNPLTLLTFGMFGETLPNQDGAPVRMVMPWKYGYFREHQIDRQGSLREGHAADHLKHCERARIRVLLQRESAGGPSSLESGLGAASGWIFLRQANQNGNVQWLRRSGGQHVHGGWICASITEELSRPRFQRHGSFAAHKRTVAQASGVSALFPGRSRISSGWVSTTNWARTRWNTSSHSWTGTWTLVALCVTLSVTPLRRAFWIKTG